MHTHTHTLSILKSRFDVVSRFHDVGLESVLECDVVLHLDDNIQLSVERYRERVYAAIAGKRTRMMRRRQANEGEEPEEATPTPTEATPTSERAKSVADAITPATPRV